MDVKAALHDYLCGARETLLWKLDGLSEYEIRTPMTPTGTNLLGLVKHSTATHLGYFGDVFGRNANSPTRHAKAAEPNDEFWAMTGESREDLIARYREAWDLSDQTINELSLDAVGQVSWWGDASVTLHRVLVHVTAETQRHAGHADIVRELIDGGAGLLRGHDNLHISDRTEQQAFHDRVEASAAKFR